MEGSPTPPQITALAVERAAARAERDWATADALKARIEEAGWRVEDEGMAFSLEPTRPPDVIEDDRTVYGSVDSVPSRLDQPSEAAASVIVVAGPGTAAPGRTLDGVRGHCPSGTQMLLVADRSVVAETAVDEEVRTTEPLSAGDALQVGLRRATGETIVVLEPERVPNGDIVGPLVAALDDERVAVAGLEGLHSSDLLRFTPADPGSVTTLGSGCYAFRRRDAIKRGPVDGRLQLRGSVAAWWGLHLRDAGPDAEPRQALGIELPLETGAEVSPLPDDHARRARRDGYRIAEHFRGCDWLAGEEPPEGRFVGDGADGDDEHDETHQSGDADET